MAYMYANEVKDVVAEQCQSQEMIELLVEKFYQEIVTEDNQKLLDLAFNENLQQADLDAFMQDWDIEENTGNKAIMVAYLMKERPDLHFPEAVKPRLAGLLKYHRFQNLQSMKYLRPDLPRVMGDIDILVHPNDYQKTCELAKGLGYWFEDNPRAHSVDLHLSENDEAGVVDIHRWIYLNSKYDIGYMDRFFDRSSKKKIFGADVYLPCAEDMVFIALLNLSKNLYKNTSMKGVLYTLFDCKFLLQSAPNFDWNLVVQSTIETNCQVQMYFAMKFVNRIIPGLLPQELFENKELKKKIDKYCNMVMFSRFYVDDLRQTCKKIRIKNALCHLSVMKEYLKYKPKYFCLKMIKKSSWAIRYFLKIANKLKGNA